MNKRSWLKNNPQIANQIVKFIKENPGCTRDQIAEGTKIKLQTVTGNVSHLVKKGLIEEQGTTLNGSGRKVGKLWSSAAPVTSDSLSLLMPQSPRRNI